nr:hypothetical protein [Tanacetum cinerariifolium]
LQRREIKNLRWVRLLILHLGGHPSHMRIKSVGPIQSPVISA